MDVGDRWLAETYNESYVGRDVLLDALDKIGRHPESVGEGVASVARSAAAEIRSLCDHVHAVAEGDDTLNDSWSLDDPQLVEVR